MFVVIKKNSIAVMQTKNEFLDKRFITFHLTSFQSFIFFAYGKKSDSYSFQCLECILQNDFWNFNYWKCDTDLYAAEINCR